MLLFQKSSSSQASKPHRMPCSSGEAGGTLASQDLLAILNCSWQHERRALGDKSSS